MKKNTKRFITALLFMIGLVGLLLAASRVTVPKSNDPDSGIEQIVANGIQGEKPGTVDVMFLGDSEAHSTFIPLQIWKDTGYTSYNCGTGDQTLDYSYTMLKRAIKKQNIRIVFLEANAIYNLESKGILYAKLCDMLPVFRYHNRWKTLRWDDFSQKPEYTWTDPDKGYRFIADVVPCDEPDYLDHDYTEEKAHIRPINRYYINRIKKLCDKNGIKLVLISSPSTAYFTYKRHNGTTALASELGCEFIDMNMMSEELGIDWSKNTRDEGSHLNFSGAEKTTAWVSEYLTQTGLLTNHKDDPAYAGWNDALAVFEDKLKADQE